MRRKYIFAFSLVLMILMTIPSVQMVQMGAEWKMNIANKIRVINIIKLHTCTNRQILKGYYYHEWNTEKVEKVSFSWDVTSGGPIDVFLLTEGEYNDWGGSSTLPSSAIYMNVDTYSGSYETTTGSGCYQVVFSNVRGSDDVYVDIFVKFKFDRTIELLLLLFLFMPERVNPSRLIIIGVISAVVVASVILAIVFAIRRKQRLRIKETVTKPLSEKPLDKSDVVSADLICPSCKAPLKKKRPTKCEYCGRLIE